MDGCHDRRERRGVSTGWREGLQPVDIFDEEEQGGDAWMDGWMDGCGI